MRLGLIVILRHSGFAISVVASRSQRGLCGIVIQGAPVFAARLDAIDDVVAEMKDRFILLLSESRNKVLQQTALDDRLEAWPLQGLPRQAAGMWPLQVRATNDEGQLALAYRADQSCAGRETQIASCRGVAHAWSGRQTNGEEDMAP